MYFKNQCQRLSLIFALLISTVGCDQITKSIARETLGDQVLSYLGDSVRLQLAENPGAFLNLGADWSGPWRFFIFTFAVAIFLLLTLVILLRKKDLELSPTVGMTLILAGGFGNLVDRALKGSVTDFLNLGVGWLRTGIFNVADLAISLGVLLLILLSFGPRRVIGVGPQNS